MITRIDLKTGKTMSRVGRCGALPRCRQDCTAFAKGRDSAGWTACVCGHTQQVHAMVEVTA